MKRRLPIIAITPGEPAGIGPDICVMLAQKSIQAHIVFIADPTLLLDRAKMLSLPFTTGLYNETVAAIAGFSVMPVTLNASVVPGKLTLENAHYVLEALRTAAQGCMDGRFDALVTGPIQKSIINDAGISFSGHTEFLAELTGCVQPVMMLATKGLRVALVTTHLPLKDVATAITLERVERVTRTLIAELKQKYAIKRPRILVCGLNPHAGEDGHLGREEIDIITPVLEQLRAEQNDIIGPLPADTLFSPSNLQHCDAVLAMYHDQGLPVLKYKGFGNAINITLGLPIIRTSVDHGTALPLAGSGKCNPESLYLAVETAIEMARNNTNGT